MSISECFGEFRTGKTRLTLYKLVLDSTLSVFYHQTQIAHTICVTAQIAGQGHGGGKVAFIDTECTFRPDRLRPIAERFNLDAEAVLRNIGIAC